MNDPIFRLISTASDLSRPRVLHEGSLKACLDEMVEAVLVDVAACNRGTLQIAAVYESIDDARRQLEVSLIATTTSGQSY